MSPQDFIRKWGPHGPAWTLNERQGAQPHFIDLCAVLGVDAPDDVDSYCFEKGAMRVGAQRGFADVWKRNHFAWEYKAPPADPLKSNAAALDAALRQLMQYALALDNPPLLVVCDRHTVRIASHFTGTPSETWVLQLTDLGLPAAQDLLRRVFTAPETFRPQRTNRQITEEAAAAFADLAERLRGRGIAHERVSHFLTQCLFSFFAEDVNLLPGRLFEKLVGQRIDPQRLTRAMTELFTRMRDGGLFGSEDVPWFDGGLFQVVDVPPLVEGDLRALKAASAMRWNHIDVSIFGTLFERGLDSAKRSQLGAHYTDPATIMRLVDPVLRSPLLAAWAQTRPAIAAELGRSKRHNDAAYRRAKELLRRFHDSLAAYRVLDPACGSGNFLFLGLKVLKDIEHQANTEAEVMGLDREVDLVTGPHNVLGIELNGYAAELARVSVWIGELQWRILHGYPFKLDPVLEPLENIECRDAVLDDDGNAAAWPAASVVIGNPPFVGDKRMRAELGDDYVERLRGAYSGRVPGGADLVCYWFEKAREQLAHAGLGAAGLVATNSIRQGANRQVLQQVLAEHPIFEAWSDTPWVNDGAAVRVSLIAFGRSAQSPVLDGKPVAAIYADLRAQANGGRPQDLTVARALRENAGGSFFGFCLAGPFTVDATIARGWLRQPNPHGRSNAAVLSPIWNGADVTRRPADRWAIDFGADMDETEAALYEAPFAHVLAAVKPIRDANRRVSRSRWWWRHGETRPGLRAAGHGLARWIVTSETAKHRFFVWLPRGVAPEHKLVVVPRADDTTFGILSSRIHGVWAVAAGGRLGVGNDPVYTTSRCFDPFPFPAGLTPADTSQRSITALSTGARVPSDLAPDVHAHAAAIASEAQRLDALRKAWIDPPEWTDRVGDVVPPGMDASPYPDRTVVKPGFEAELAKRTLTRLYNERPQWLAQAHTRLDAAVAAAYEWGDWTPAMPDDEILGRLLALNAARAALEAR